MNALIDMKNSVNKVSYMKNVHDVSSTLMTACTIPTPKSNIKNREIQAKCIFHLAT